MIGEFFWDYPYDKGEGGLKAFIPIRQVMDSYIKALVVASIESGIFYSTDNGEGYILITDSNGSHLGFASILKMVRDMKNAMGGWKLQAISCFLKASSYKN